jgi:hypothetical protein
MQPQSKVVCKAHKRGCYGNGNEESSWGRGDSEFQILVMPPYEEPLKNWQGTLWSVRTMLQT